MILDWYRLIILTNLLPNIYNTDMHLVNVPVQDPENKRENIIRFISVRRRVWAIMALFTAVLVLPTRARDVNKLDPVLKILLAQPSLITAPIYKPLTKVSQSDTTIDIFIRTTDGVGNRAGHDGQIHPR